MTQTLLTPTAVTREALRILHQKLNFVGSVDRQYDDRFAKKGAKIGTSLLIRKPNKFTVRTGRAMNVQDIAETSETLTVATQKGVDVNFTSVELTMSLDDFSKRVLQPAMSVLAANIEADAMSMYKDVYNQVNNLTAPVSFRKIMEAKKILTDNLAPEDNRACSLNTTDMVDLVDANKGLFNPAGSLSSDFRQGRIGGQLAGFQDFYENTLWSGVGHTTGSAAGDATGTVTASPYVLSGSHDAVSAITATAGAAGTLLDGDIIVISGLYRVHPETKGTTTTLQQFVVTTSVTSSATSIPISPAIVASGANQNVATVGASGAAIYKVGATSDAHGLSMAYHKEAFVFATADLILPDGVHFAAREVMDGISMRIIQQYTASDDTMPCRMDVLYGYKAVRPELACRIACM